MSSRLSLDYGVIEKWYKKEGDLIKRDEVICDIRTEVSLFRAAFHSGNWHLLYFALQKLGITLMIGVI